MLYRGEYQEEKYAVAFRIILARLPCISIVLFPTSAPLSRSLYARVCAAVTHTRAEKYQRISHGCPAEVRATAMVPRNERENAFFHVEFNYPLGELSTHFWTRSDPMFLSSFASFLRPISGQIRASLASVYSPACTRSVAAATKLLLARSLVIRAVRRWKSGKKGAPRCSLGIPMPGYR